MRWVIIITKLIKWLYVVLFYIKGGDDGNGFVRKAYYIANRAYYRFAVLILLILLITVYGAIVSRAQKSSAEKKAKKEAELEAEKTASTASAQPVATPPAAVPAAADGMSDEVIAVIAAAVDAVYGKGAKVKSIKKVPQSRPVWSTAGILDNTRPF